MKKYIYFEIKLNFGVNFGLCFVTVKTPFNALITVEKMYIYNMTWTFTYLLLVHQHQNRIATKFKKIN